MTGISSESEIAALEAEVRELRSKLENARESILDLVPLRVRELLLDRTNIAKYQSVFDWASDVAEQVLGHAKPRPAKEMNDFGSLSDRAFCPLCGRSSVNLYGEHGFAYPEGLRSHLLGTHTARECVAMEAAKQLIRDEISKNRAGHV
jgi:hypothetical protein